MVRLLTLPTHKRVKPPRAPSQSHKMARVFRFWGFVLWFHLVGENPRRADGRFPMFGSPVEVAVGIAAATAKVMASLHSPSVKRGHHTKPFDLQWQATSVNGGVKTCQCGGAKVGSKAGRGEILR